MAVSGTNILIVVVSIIAPIIYSGQTTFIIQKLNELCHWKLGCNPIQSVGNVTLHYFAVRGRAEAIRLLMEDHMIPYYEVKYDEDSWPAAKQKGVATGLYTFGQLPVITTSKNRHLAQSKAILHYLGRSVGLDCDCNDLAKCDMVASGVEDLRQKQSEIVFHPDAPYKMRNEYISSTLPTWLKYFEKLISGDSINWYFNTGLGEDGPYFASGRLTWLDYLVFDMIENNCDFLEQTKPLTYEEGITLDNDTFLEMPDNCFQLLEKFPHLSIFSNNFKSRSNIAAYMMSSRRTSYRLPLRDK